MSDPAITGADSQAGPCRSGRGHRRQQSGAVGHGGRVDAHAAQPVPARAAAVLVQPRRPGVGRRPRPHHPGRRRRALHPRDRPRRAEPHRQPAAPRQWSPPRYRPARPRRAGPAAGRRPGVDPRRPRDGRVGPRRGDGHRGRRGQHRRPGRLGADADHRHLHGRAVAARRHRLRRHPRPVGGPARRPDRRVRVAHLGADRPIGRPQRARARLRQGRHRGGHPTTDDHAPPPAPRGHPAGHRQRGDARRHGHPLGGRAVLPRPGRRPAAGVLGEHAPRAPSRSPSSRRCRGSGCHPDSRSSSPRCPSSSSATGCATRSTRRPADEPARGPRPQRRVRHPRRAGARRARPVVLARPARPWGSSASPAPARRCRC